MVNAPAQWSSPEAGLHHALTKARTAAHIPGHNIRFIEIAVEDDMSMNAAAARTDHEA
ncbi:hypothetical protein [Phyllobacterium myrsinacearum]|uniref:hypothetical protein n=1 Tax=Phyllobacterium myrsinacearum TaxID=28101 RepID=UPI000D980660|nr:hypothetical protein [Phyllobacterium myrsinacearum]PWV92367.1 hypothetical protein DEV92_104244 [Phyllobacterium myrsinacearum]RZS77827.1 hypothetical protein EV217_4494 [Phyllobacterium myrsinacearum]RZV04825.1 hypothetical protein EV654_3631 [Phyllobacterium myrsinacearum]